MHVVLGADGHVGSAVAHELLSKREGVTVVLHSASHVDEWRTRGARTAVVDLHDASALRETLHGARRLFLLNPPAAPSTDTDAEERATLTAILSAIESASLETVVAASTYGARPGAHLGDLGVLYEMEQALAASRTAAIIVRSAYYFSNLDAALDSARNEGTVPTLFPPAFRLPMVDPCDIGRFAASQLISPRETGIHHAEGPARYSYDDVAKAFAAVLGRPVQAVETPRARWPEVLATRGFSKPAAESFAAMTLATLEGGFPDETSVHHGPTSLEDHVRRRVDPREVR